MTSDNPAGPPSSLVAGAKNVQIRWQDSEGPAPQIANAFQLQFTPEGLMLVAGFANPPLLSGTAEEQAKQAEAIDWVPVRPGLRLLFGYHHVQYLAAAFQQALEQVQKGLPPPPIPPGPEQAH